MLRIWKQNTLKFVKFESELRLASSYKIRTLLEYIPVISYAWWWPKPAIFLVCRNRKHSVSIAAFAEWTASSIWYNVCLEQKGASCVNVVYSLNFASEIGLHLAVFPSDTPSTLHINSSMVRYEYASPTCENKTKLKEGVFQIYIQGHIPFFKMSFWDW